MLVARQGQLSLSIKIYMYTKNVQNKTKMYKIKRKCTNKKIIKYLQMVSIKALPHELTMVEKLAPRSKNNVDEVEKKIILVLLPVFFFTSVQKSFCIVYYIVYVSLEPFALSTGAVKYTDCFSVKE